MTNTSIRYDQTIDIGEIEEFPHDGRIWRLDYFGYLDRDHVFSDPKIYVTLSPIKDVNISRFYSAAVLNKETTKPIPIGIGLIPLLHLGSLWKDGKMVAPLSQDEAKCETFPINISPETVKLIRIRDLYETGGYEFSKFRWSYCLAVKVKNNPHGLIIPCSELFRFYFATSQALTQKLIFGQALYLKDIEKINELVMFLDQDTKKRRTGPTEDGFLITLRKILPDSDAWTLSRILGDPIALREACNIHKAISAANMNNTGLYFKLGFPFIGTTKLKVQGKITRNDNGDSHFLALRILNCTHPFPYEKVIVDRELKGTSGSKEQGDAAFNWNSQKRNGSSQSSGKKPNITSNSESNVDIERRRVIVPETRFSFLVGRNLIHEEKEVSQYRRKPVYKSPAEIEAESTSEGQANNSSIRPLGTSIDKEKDIIPAYFDELILAIKQLELEYGVKWNVYYRDKGIFVKDKCLSTFEINGKRQSNAWIFINKQTRQVRKFLLINFQWKAKHFSLLELERETNRFGIYILTRTDNPYARVGSAELNLLMKMWGQSNHYRTSIGLDEINWKLYSIKHVPEESINNLARRIKEFIEAK